MPIRERNAPHSFRRLLTLASDAAPAVCATYFCTAVHAGFQNVLRARQPFRFPRSPAFVIDRGRSRFRARNAPHSFRRLLTHAHKRCRPAVCATYFVQLYTRSFQMLCGTAIAPLFASAFAIAIVRGICCFRRLRYIFRASVRCLLIIPRHGNCSTFCIRLRH